MRGLLRPDSIGHRGTCPKPLIRKRRRFLRWHSFRPAGARAYHSVVASLNEGVLTVTVPESEAAKPRHVEITG